MSKTSTPQLSMVGSKMTTLEAIHGYRRVPAVKAYNSDHSLSSFADKGFTVLPHIRLASQLRQRCSPTVDINSKSVHTDASLQVKDADSVLSTFRECWISDPPVTTQTADLKTADREETFQTQGLSLTTENSTDSHFSKCNTSACGTSQRKYCSKHSGVKCLESNHNKDDTQISQHLNHYDTSLSIAQVKKLEKKKKKKSKNHRNKVKRSKSGKKRRPSNYDERPHKLNEQAGVVNTFQPQIIQVVRSPSKTVTKHKISLGSSTVHQQKAPQTNISASHLMSLLAGKSSPRDTDLKTDQFQNNPYATHLQNGGNVKKLIKVYCSDKQSGLLKELGQEFPCAPPASPMPALLQHYEYIPSMNDIRAQRALKVQLEAICKVEKKKQEKLKEEKYRKQKILNKEKENDIKKQQRQEIYALNKVMTALENANFKDFCEKNGLNI